MTYDEMEREINEIPKFGANASLSNLTAYLDQTGDLSWVSVGNYLTLAPSGAHFSAQDAS